jgi:hypothetical protein
MTWAFDDGSATSYYTGNVTCEMSNSEQQDPAYALSYADLVAEIAAR